MSTPGNLPRPGEPDQHLSSIPPPAVVMLDADILSVVLHYVDTLDKTPRSTSSAASSAHADHQHHAVRGGAECRRVSRTWRVSTEEAIGRELPPIASVSLASLLVPGRLRFVLLSCRYNHEHGVATVAVYDALVSRAEAVGLRLREAAAATQETAVNTSALLAAHCSEATGGVTAGARKSESGTRNDDGIRTNTGTTSSPGGNRNCLCCRVALKRIVGEALSNPAFSWCSTLGTDDSRLLEGCVGTPSLLQARWYS